MRIPFSWFFLWIGEFGAELNFDIFAAILFSIIMDFIVILLFGLWYRSSQGSHCRNNLLIFIDKIKLYCLKFPSYSYPGGHGVGVGVPVVEVEDEDCEEDAAGHHPHDEVEVCPCMARYLW